MKIKSILVFLMVVLLIIGCNEKKPDEITDTNIPSDNTAVENETEVASNSDLVNEDDSSIIEENTEEEAEKEEVLEESVVDDEPESEPEVTVEPAKPVYVAVTDMKLSFYDVSIYIGESKMPKVTMYPQNASNKGEIWTSSDTSVATVDSIGRIKGVSIGNCTVTVQSVDNPDIKCEVNVNVKTDGECTYIDGILVVNKTYSLPRSYAPGWETEASPYLWKMISAAKSEGIELWMTSGYRSYYDQEYIYNGYVARDGQEAADTYSARPGHSEHQTGLAYDLNDLYHNFGETPEGIWVAENCHKYGFILRYPKGKEDITGYIYEPWHIRYIGVEKATEVYESGLCLEEFLGITSSYSEQ